MTNEDIMKIFLEYKHPSIVGDEYNNAINITTRYTVNRIEYSMTVGFETGTGKYVGASVIMSNNSFQEIRNALIRIYNAFLVWKDTQSRSVITFINL
jgi:hypothetical protein